MIGVDWGTSSFRAYRMNGDGAVLDAVAAPRGILEVPAGGFAAELRRHVGPWLEDGETRILLAGMIGSRQGWVEAAYLPCPAGEAELAAALIDVGFDAKVRVRLVPGLSASDAGGTPEVMRGEETQVIGGVAGALDGSGLVCLPGSHSKWVRMVGQRIAGFETYMTGEAFSALRGGTILGRMMVDGPADDAAFDRGVARSGEAGHLLHQLFGVRTLGLFGRLAEGESASYLSGLLIGHELRAACPPGSDVTLIGAGPLCALYERALTACGSQARLAGDSARQGLHRIATRALWN